jgi:hypothetical protein
MVDFSSNHVCDVKSYIDFMKVKLRFDITNDDFNDHRDAKSHGARSVWSLLSANSSENL